jgi:hypothetical protein
MGSVASYRIAAAALVVIAAPPALAEGRYSVRNEAGRTFSCGLRHETRSVIERFVLRDGAEWTNASPGEGERVLLCDSWKFTQRWRMRPGVPYVLANDPHSGFVVLRAAAAAR